MKRILSSAICILLAATLSAQSPNRQIDEIVVTGSNGAVGRNLQPYTVSTVTAAQIESTGKGQLLSALSGTVPGLFITERNILGFGISNGGAGGIKIRGVGGSPTNAVLMMVDGQPQFAGIFSHHVADFYTTEYVERVEVLRGPGSVLYGSNAMGGVINVITKESAREGCFTTLSTEYGSYNTWRSSATNMSRVGKFSSLVSLAYDRTDGTEENFDFNQKSLYAKVGYDISREWSARADYSLTGSIGNDPIYARLDNPSATDIYHQNITRGEASLSFANNYGGMNGNVRTYYSYGNHYVDDPRHFHSLDDRFGIIAYENIALWNGANATVGFDFDTYTGEIPVSGGNGHTPGSLATIRRKSITEYSPYITMSQSLLRGRMILNGGLRMANSDRFGTEWVPQCGVVLHPGGEWMIKGSFAKGYRNPSFKELYLYRMANADLSPEQMTNCEITVGKSFSGVANVELTAFCSDGDNLIQVVDMKNRNTGSFVNKGVEFSASAQAAENLSLRASYSYLHTSLDDLVAAPKNQFYVAVQWLPLSGLTIDASLKAVDGLYVSPEESSEDYMLLGAKISYIALRKTDKSRLLELFTTLDNITDCSYTINRGYKMPGFTFSLGTKLHI
ncbi:MAG: TonB-dependent receptor [Bacteroidaceae bacterium]|nr:TonB-dependent receptor [Bacteroidaceae bacterium]